MGIKCENTCKSAFSFRRLHRPFDDRLMADVDTIENSECEMQRHAESGQVFKAVANQHRVGIAVGSGDFKPYKPAARPFCKVAARVPMDPAA